MNITPETAEPITFPADWQARPVLSVEECAAVLKLHHTTVRNSIAAGELPSVRVGRRVLVPVAGLIKFIGA